MSTFDSAALKLFEDKGIVNSQKVRRIMQLTSDLSRRKFSDLRILDLGCGEGVYALEAGINGSKVVAIDGRDNRLKFGKEVAERHSFSNVEFIVDDVRNVTIDKYGKFDVIYFLGLLYHLDEPELWVILENLSKACENIMLIDTTIGLSEPLKVNYNGKNYFGIKYDEHIEGDSEELMLEKRIMASIGNKKSFLPTKKSLVRFLNEIGFSTVMEVHAPAEHIKKEGRITLVAIKNEKTLLKSYPWINGLTDTEIGKKLDGHYAEIPHVVKQKPPFKTRIKLMIDKWLEKRGYELRKKLRN